MSGSILKTDLFERLGYGPPYEPHELVLEEAGLSRPEKTGIALWKAGEVAATLGDRLVAVCSRGDCQNEVSGESERVAVSALAQGDCAFCGGSTNARAVELMVKAWTKAGLSKLCVVGGSPNARTELEAIVDGALELRLVDGLESRTSAQAAADLAWADRVALWGGTQLAHKVSRLYKGAHVVQFAKRSIGELARAMRISAGAPRWAVPPD